jgi:hypothetical protein
MRAQPMERATKHAGLSRPSTMVIVVVVSRAAVVMLMPGEAGKRSAHGTEDAW